MSFLPHSFGCGLPIRESIKRLYPVLTSLAIGPLLFRENIQGMDLLAIVLTIFGQLLHLWMLMCDILTVM